MDQRLKAAAYLQAILPLMGDLVAFDGPAAAAVANSNLVVQFEVADGLAAHLRIHNGTIVHGMGRHPRPGVRLRFKSPEMLNRMFAGENIRPGIRKGFLHLGFLLRRLPVVSERLAHYLEGEGKSAPDAESQKNRIRLGIHAMLAGMTAMAAHDQTLRRIAEETPAGTLLVRVLPDGPHGTFEKHLDAGGASRFCSTFCEPVKPANAVMEFADAQVAQKVIDGELNVVTAIGLGSDIRIRGLLPLIDKAGIFLYRFGRIMGPAS